MATDCASAEAGSTMLSIEKSEFERLQTQLIDLRTANYTVKEEHSKLKTEVTQLQSTLQTQTRELEKANKTIQRSKKAREVSALVEENDRLQQKMETQEEDFRLQNKTLMDELSRVMDEKEHASSELDDLRQRTANKLGGDSPKMGEAGGVASEEVTYLKAENSALQKSIQTLQERLTDHTDSGEGNGEQSEDSGTTEKVLALELRLATEEEEKKLLRQQLEELQVSVRKQQAELQSELDKWMDKAKKKQDSLVQLQEEKEKHFQESRSSFEEMVRSKDHQIGGLQSKLEALKNDLNSRKEISTAGQEIAKQLESLSTEREELSLRCSTLIMDKESLVGEQSRMVALTDELGKELQQARLEATEEKKRSQNLITELEEAKLSQEQLADQVVKTSEEKHKLQQEVDSLQKLAEKRKNLLDEMSIKGQLSSTEQQKKLDELEQEHSDQISKLESMLQQEKSYLHTLSEANEELPSLREQAVTLGERVGELEVQVTGLTEDLEGEREEHARRVEELTNENEETIKGLSDELEAGKEELSVSAERVRELEMEVEDKQAGVKIVEKKSMALLKDLKQQLKQMQKREERLQEQLNQLKGGVSLDYTSMPSHESIADSASKHSRDSSLSSMRGIREGGAEGLNSPLSGLSGASLLSGQVSVNEETTELLGRVAELQEDKWALEARVSHLENTGSALAEDVIQKSEIIKSYFMANKADHSPVVPKRSPTDKMSPMRLVNWAKGGGAKGDEVLAEINRKMQRALEEALMKNIHLHENIEMLTTELEKQPSQRVKTKVASSGEDSELETVPKTNNEQT
ncbi:GRIP1-associated protein 1-like [Halichondria panicea]|uniref:GRIP1-associated protein 1-like n=1 Tax=Halichondria panicea TaxID=6063 RepID=UPI00312B6934